MSTFTYFLFILFALLVVAAVTVSFFAAGPRRTWATITNRPIDPFEEPESEWIDQEPDSFIADLVRRRQVFDLRLKDENIGHWLMWRFRETPDGLIYDVVVKYMALEAAGVAGRAICERLEEHRNAKGSEQLPAPYTLSAYIEFRLGLEDPEFLALGSEFIAGHIELCRRFAEHRTELDARYEWPPKEWLGRQLSMAEFEYAGDKIDPLADGAPAVSHVQAERIESELSNLKCLMIPSDELWTFSSPPESWQELIGRAGIVLIRKGRPVGHIVTKMN